MKKCSKCDIEKPEQEFVKDAVKAGGRSTRCKVCDKAYKASYYKENKELVSAKNKEWRDSNKEYKKAKNREYYLANKDKKIASSLSWSLANPLKRAVFKKAWRDKNKGKINAYDSKRRAAELQRTPKWADLEKIADVYELAVFVREVTGESYHVDHEIPLQGKLVSGLHVHNNLRIIKAADNMRKSNKYEI